MLMINNWFEFQLPSHWCFDVHGLFSLFSWCFILPSCISPGQRPGTTTVVWRFGFGLPLPLSWNHIP
jgi:hypothetical protein